MLTNNGIDPASHEEWLKYNEESLTFSEFREERLRLILNTRILLSKINKSLGLFSRSFHILKHGFNTLIGSIFEDFMSEKGTDPEIEIGAVSFGDPKDTKGGKAPAKDKAPPAKKDAKSNATIQNSAVLSEEQYAVLLKTETARLGNNLVTYKLQRGVDTVFWIKYKTLLADSMYFQNRKDDLYSLIDVARKDCESLKDNVYERMLLGVKARTKANEGKKDEALNLFELAVGMGKKYHHKDNSYGKL